MCVFKHDESQHVHFQSLIICNHLGNFCSQSSSFTQVNKPEQAYKALFTCIQVLSIKMKLGGELLKMAKHISSPIITKPTGLIGIGLIKMYTMFERKRMIRSLLFPSVNTKFWFVSENN